MNIIVTGGVGFVGTNLVKRLKEDGHKVIVIDDYSIGTVDNQIEGVRYLPMNVEQIDFIKGDEVDLCFHLAALSRIQPSFETPSEFFRVNVSGTEAVCEWARKWNVKVVYSGSSSQWHDHGIKLQHAWSRSRGTGRWQPLQRDSTSRESERPFRARIHR